MCVVIVTGGGEVTSAAGEGGPDGAEAAADGATSRSPAHGGGRAGPTTSGTVTSLFPLVLLSPCLPVAIL